MEITEATLKDSITVCGGQFRDVYVNLYSIVRDEMFFLPAFFNYYRKLGVEQFILLDDGSTDGTVEFLRAQPDCILISSSLSYGQEITVTKANGKRIAGRAGVFLKRTIPEKFLLGKYALYVDADEFLILPAEFRGIPALFEDLSTRRLPCVAASVIDFFPANSSALKTRNAPLTFADLLAGSPYFDAEPLLKMRPGAQPTLAGMSSSARLFKQNRIKQTPVSFLPEWIVDALPFPVPSAVWRKTPIIRWSTEVWMTGSHRANVAPPADRFLALAHFKFTSDFPRRVDAAMKRKSHARNSQKYFYYFRLLQKMHAGDGNFLGAKSRIFEGPDGLIQAGLMRWPL